MSNSGSKVGHTEVLLGGTTLLKDLNEAGLQLFDGGNVVGENTHLTGGGGDVDLGPVVAKDSSVFREQRTWTRRAKKRTRRSSGR